MRSRVQDLQPVDIRYDLDIQRTRPVAVGQCVDDRLAQRFGRLVASLAILADPHRNWRPDGYGFEAFGCRHWLHFPVVKLLDYEAGLEALLTDPN